MKKMILTATTVAASLLIAQSAFAYVNGPYLGGALGWGDVHQAGFTDLNNNSADETGIAGRVFGGYKFNNYIALESGFTKFSNINATGSIPSLDFTANGSVKTYAVDLIAKGMLPMKDGVGLFATLGLAYLNQQSTIHSYAPTFGHMNDQVTQSVLAPTFGLGGSYEINKNLVADISWSRIQAHETNNHNNTSVNTSNTDFVGLNLSYHFG